MTKFNDVTKGKGKWVTRAEMAGILAAIKGSTQEVQYATGDDVLVKNETSESHSIYSVLKVTESILTPSNNASGYKFGPIRLRGDEVDTDDQSAVVVLQEPASTGKIVRAKASGETKVRLTGPLGGPDTDNKNATTRAGAYTLEASDSGPCVILYDPGPADEDRIAIVRIGGGGSASSQCKSQWRIIVWGRPTGGTFSLPIIVKDASDPDDPGTSQTISFTYNADAATVKTQFETHSLIDTGEVKATFHGGAFPSHEAVVSIESDEIDIDIGVPTLSLSGGSDVFVHLRKCCS